MSLEKINEYIEKLEFHECDGCSLCCEHIFLLEEEHNKLLEIFGGERILNNEVAYEEEKGPCVFAKNNRCLVYKYRPFNCRIFPLDIQYIKDDYYWIIYETCPKNKEIEKKINDSKLVEFLNKNMTKSIFEQHKKMIEETSDKYPPIVEGKYRIIEKVSCKFPKQDNGRDAEKNT